MSEPAGNADTLDAAIVWALRLNGGLLTDDDAEALGDWLANSPHRLDALSEAQAVLAPVVETTPAANPPAEEQPLSRRGFLSMALTAGVGVAVIGGLLYLAGRHRYRTDIGEIGHVLLPDGSMAILNTATEIELAFTDRDRRVKLVRGEALFDVELDVRRLFSIEASGLRVQTYGAQYPRRIRPEHASLGALIDFGRDIARPLTEQPSRAGFEARGTTLAIRIKPGARVEIAVLEGTVDVSRRAPKRFDTKTLSWNSMLSAGPDAYPESSMIDTKALEARLAWLERRIVFDEGATIRDVAGEFNRYNELRLVVGDSVANRQVRGTFYVDRPIDFVHTMESLGIGTAEFGEGIVTIF